MTTHTVENVLLPEEDLMRKFVGNPADKLLNLFDPKIPLMTGVVQNQDSYMKGKIAQRAYCAAVMPAFKRAMGEYAELTGRRYEVVESYRMEDADYAIVGMGSLIDTTEATIDWIRDELQIKVGAVHITCFRPFPSVEVVQALQHVKAFSVVERMDNPLAPIQPCRPRNQVGLRRRSGRSGRVPRNRLHTLRLLRICRPGFSRRASWPHHRGGAQYE